MIAAQRSTRNRQILLAVCLVPPNRWSNPRYLALLRIDAVALRRGQVRGEELCEIAGIGPVPVSAARTYSAMPSSNCHHFDQVDVANITHLGRGPTTAQKIAMMWTNLCSVQGCHRRRIEYDHQEPWAQTKHTRASTNSTPGPSTTTSKTRPHWALEPGKGTRAPVPPDDPRHPSQQPAPSAKSMSGSHSPLGRRRPRRLHVPGRRQRDRCTSAIPAAHVDARRPDRHVIEPKSA